MTNPPPDDERKGLPSVSKALQYKLCPGSYQLCQTVPPEPESQWAAEGTLGHTLLENMAWRQFFSASPVDPEAGTDTLHAVTLAWGHVEDLLHEFLGLAWKAKIKSCHVLLETRAWFHSADGAPLYSGRNDLAILDHAGRLLLMDYKFGRGEVDAAAENVQLRALSVALAQQIDRNNADDTTITENLPAVTEVWAAVIQPRVDPAVTAARYTREDLDRAAAEVMGIFQAVYATNPPRSAGYRQCLYCAAKSVCPEARGAVDALAGLAPVPAAELDDTKAKELATTLSVDQLGALLHQCDTAETIASAIRAEAMARAKLGVIIPGWRLKPNSPARQIENTQAAWERVASIVPVEQFVGACKVSVSQLEAALVAAKGIPKKEGKKALAEALGNALTMKDKNPSLVADE